MSTHSDWRKCVSSRRLTSSPTRARNQLEHASASRIRIHAEMEDYNALPNAIPFRGGALAVLTQGFGRATQELHGDSCPSR